MAGELAVGGKEAARRLNLGYQRLLDLVHEGRIAVVPHASTKSKLVIAIAELERFAAEGVTTTPATPARSLRRAS